VSTPSPAETSSQDVAEFTIVPTGIARMLIVRLGAMGDVIHGLYAAAALREAFPEMLLGWLIWQRVVSRSTSAGSVIPS